MIETSTYWRKRDAFGEAGSVADEIVNREEEESRVDQRSPAAQLPHKLVDARQTRLAGEAQHSRPAQVPSDEKAERAAQHLADDGVERARQYAEEQSGRQLHRPTAQWRKDIGRGF